jgi:acetyl-CoA/propionyl-CoA carboxylase biotin carboxyl carrier protein
VKSLFLDTSGWFAALSPKESKHKQARSVYTTWIETDFDNTIPPYAPASQVDSTVDNERTTVVVEVGGKRLEVSLPAGFGGVAPRAGSGARAPLRGVRTGHGPTPSGDSLTSPMQGTSSDRRVEGTPWPRGQVVVLRR